MSWMTLAAMTRYDHEVKGSRFSSICMPIASRDEALDRINEFRQANPSASHCCSAYRVGIDVAFDDDGEPGGTAGRPMLEVLVKRDLDFVLAVCLRWFGGTKLGAGGLVRAYGGSVAKALDVGEVVTVHPTSMIEVRVPFALSDVAHRMLTNWPEVGPITPLYDVQGVRFRTVVRTDAVPLIQEACKDATRNAAQVLEVEHEQ